MMQLGHTRNIGRFDLFARTQPRDFNGLAPYIPVKAQWVKAMYEATMALQAIKDRINAAALTAGRAPADVCLIAVSKVQPLPRVAAILEQGQREFGENRVQEAAGKWPAFRDSFPDIRLHLIGPLQTNKARAAVELFDMIHTLDRIKLAEVLARLAQERGTCPALFVQVNTGAEPQKAGVIPEQADRFIAQVRALDLLPVGLMCIPPDGLDPAPHFAMLADIAARNGLSGLSMGMSSDFETAIAHGATHVRVGSAIFGERVPG
jgi:PLP dependent protein